MTVTCFMGKNTESVSPSTHKQKGRKKESKLGLQGLAVFIHPHVRQPHSMLLVLKDIHSRRTPSRLGLQPLAPPRCPHPGSPAVFFLRALFGGQPLSPKAVIGRLQSEGVCTGTGPSCLFMWVLAPTLSSTLGGSS